MNGADAEAPVPFLPPQSSARGLIVVDDVAYVATVSGCGDAPNGVWALELGSKQVATWRAASAIAGSVGPAIGPDGTVYVTTTTGELVALEPRTLKPRQTHRAGGAGFTSSPVVFEHAASVLLAASARDGRIHLLDSHRLASSKATESLNSASVAAAAVASWAAPDGTRWLLVPRAGAIVAWKVVDHDGVPTIQPGWMVGTPSWSTTFHATMAPARGTSSQRVPSGAAQLATAAAATLAEFRDSVAFELAKRWLSSRWIRPSRADAAS